MEKSGLHCRPLSHPLPKLLPPKLLPPKLLLPKLLGLAQAQAQQLAIVW